MPILLRQTTSFLSTSEQIIAMKIQEHRRFSALDVQPGHHNRAAHNHFSLEALCSFCDVDVWQADAAQPDPYSVTAADKGKLPELVFLLPCDPPKLAMTQANAPLLDSHMQMGAPPTALPMLGGNTEEVGMLREALSCSTSSFCRVCSHVNYWLCFVNEFKLLCFVSIHQHSARHALQKPKGCPQAPDSPKSENIQKFQGCPQVLSKSVRVQKFHT